MTNNLFSVLQNNQNLRRLRRKLYPFTRWGWNLGIILLGVYMGVLAYVANTSNHQINESDIANNNILNIVYLLLFIYGICMLFGFFLRVFVPTDGEDEREMDIRYKTISAWFAGILITTFVLSSWQEFAKNSFEKMQIGEIILSILTAPLWVLMLLDGRLNKKIENYDYSREK